MADSTLAAIKKKVRRLVASPSPNQLGDADLEEYIDTFYEQDFPASLKPWNLRNTLEFWTQPNEDRYDLDTELNYTVMPPLYIDGYQSFMSQSREEFFRIYPKLRQEQTGPSGTAAAGPYTYTLTNTPVLKRAVTVSVTDSVGTLHVIHDVPTDGSLTAGTWQDENGNTVTGSINYVTGAISITWPNTVDATEEMTTRYVSYQASRPGAALFFNDYFVLRPVPDKVYRVTFDVYQRPTQLLSADNVNPQVQQWWQYIAFGAAIKILQDRQDVESIKNIMPWFKEQENLVIYRTATQQSSERTATIYTEQSLESAGQPGVGGYWS